MKVFSKKQVLTTEMVIFISFFIATFTVPDNILSYSLVSVFVETIGGVFPIVENFLANPDVNPVLGFLYALVCVISVLLFIFYFFVDFGEIVSMTPEFKAKLDRKRIFRNMILSCCLGLFFFQGTFFSSVL